MFGALTVGYLFFGGTGAGACVVLAVMGLAIPREWTCSASARPGRGGRSRKVFSASAPYRRIFGPAHTTAFMALVIATLFLLGDVGVSAAPILLVGNPTATYLSVGTFVLIAALALAAFLCVCWNAGRIQVSYAVVRAAQWLALLDGLVLAGYTGLLLSSMPAVPIWSTPWLAVAFVASSLSCGSALVMACIVATGSARAFRRVVANMAFLDTVTMAVELVAALAFLGVAFTSPYDVAVQGAESLVTGSLAGLFMIGFAGIGLIVPIGIESVIVARRRDASGIALVASIAVLIGGFLLRYCIVAVGAHPQAWALVS